MIRLTRPATFALALTLALSACGPGGAPHPETPASAPVKRGPIDQAIDLLDAGKEKDATRLLTRLLRKNPNDERAMLLRNSIEQDPTAMLDGENYPYVVRQGETLKSIAETYLGSALKFYALARYNHITVPSAVTAGQLLRVPSPLLKPKPVIEPLPEEPKEPPKPVAKTKKKSAQPPAATPGAPAAPAPVQPPADNPALAGRMRSAGLAALASGNVDRAVALLQKAAALDPTNPLIQRDLGRAERIQGTVHARH
jgi:tetratricopeptide (TPR) repeat protein